MENTYWLKYAHQKLRSMGMDLPDFELGPIFQQSKQKNVNLDPSEFDKVPIITIEDLCIGARRIVDKRLHAQRSLDAINEKMHKGTVSYSAQNFDFTLKNKMGYFNLA